MPRTSRPLSILPITVREVAVQRIEDVTPAVRRLTLGGPAMGAGERDGHPVGPFRSTGFDDHVKVVVLDADGTHPDAGRQDGERFDWAPGVLPLCRDYTVRRVADDGLSFEVDVVRHPSGRASDWAFSCTVGDRVSFAGPKMCADLPEGIDWYLLVADETGLPAVTRWLEEASAGTKARIVIEVPSAADRQLIDTDTDAEITWLVRAPEVSAGHSGALLKAVRDLDLPAGRGYAWVAGESTTIAPIRRYLREVGRFDRTDVEVVGYWRRTSSAPPAPKDAEGGEPSGRLGTSASETWVATATAPDAVAPDVAATQNSTAQTVNPQSIDPRAAAWQIHEMSELLAPIALRVAVTLGIPTHLAAGATRADELATLTGVPSARLAPLLDALIALGLIERSMGSAPDPRSTGSPHDSTQEEPHDALPNATLRNTVLGEALLEESVQESLDLDHPANRAELALVGLLDTLRRGRVAAEPVIPADLATWRARDPDVDAAFHARVEDDLQWSVQPLCALPELASARDVLLLGDGTVATAAALTAEPDRRVHLVVPAASLRATRERVDAEIGTARRAQVEIVADDGSLPRADVAVVQLAQDAWDDTTFVDRARHLGDAAAHLILVTRPADAAATDDYVAADALTRLATTGVPLRTSAATLHLLKAVGLDDARCEPLGWGFGPSVITATRSPQASTPAAAEAPTDAAAHAPTQPEAHPSAEPVSAHRP